MKKNYRQGDVRLCEIAELPEGLKQKNNVVALSETHHNHVIEDATVYTDANGMQYVQVEKMARLIHQKVQEAHEQIQIPKGVYRVVHQREFSPTQNRNVMD